MSVPSLQHTTELQLLRRFLCWSSSLMYSPGFGNQPQNRTSKTGGPSSNEDAGRRRALIGSRCVDVSAPDTCGCRYEAWITKNSCGCPSDRQTPRVSDKDVHLLVDRRLPSLNRRQHALQRNSLLRNRIRPSAFVTGWCFHHQRIHQ